MTPVVRPTKLNKPLDKSFREYHEVALSALFQDCLKHPLVVDRISRTSLGDISPQTAVDILRAVAPKESSDHSAAILRTGAFGEPTLPANSGIVFSTSGTTGRPKLLINDYHEMLLNAEFHGLAYKAAGIEPSDVVATFGGTGTFASEYCVYHALAHTGCVTLPINDFRKTEENVDLLGSLQASVLLAMPSELFDIVGFLESKKLRLSNVRLVVTGGEALSSQLKGRLQLTMAADLKFGSTFQSADLGTIGYQCDYCGPGQYHIQEHLQHAEILSAGSLQPAEEGDLVITNLQRRRMPILRIFSGDRVRLDATAESPCDCGDRSMKVTLLGRRSDLVKIGGIKVHVGIFDGLATASGLLENDVAVVIRSSLDTGKDLVSIQVRGAVSRETKIDLERHILEDPSLREMIHSSRIEPLVFERLEERFDSKTQNKHRKVYDVRSAAVN